MAEDDLLFERSIRRVFPDADTMTHGAKLHKDDGMMSIFSGDRSGTAKNVQRVRLTRNGLEADCRDVVAFVDNNLPVKFPCLTICVCQPCSGDVIGAARGAM
ncbi:MAG: hypothetical protein EPN30_04505 [Actinomycetota bacterium]|nr:MAG: hypothetical protein EPN30_04505 [Actinomycetota bacterium]